jgi:hypothetical protein
MLTKRSFADTIAEEIQNAGKNVCLLGRPENFDELLNIAKRAGDMKWRLGKHVVVANALSDVLGQIQRNGRGDRIRILIGILDVHYQNIVVFGEEV